MCAPPWGTPPAPSPHTLGGKRGFKNDLFETSKHRSKQPIGEARSSMMITIVKSNLNKEEDVRRGRTILMKIIVIINEWVHLIKIEC